MALNFYFLGSGSRGNCTLVETDQWKFLIDIGFGLKKTNHFLHDIGISLEDISAAILTHTHVDHVNGPMLRRISKSNMNLLCRSEHQGKLQPFDGYRMLKEKKQIQFYTDQTFEPLPGLSVQPIPLSHDSPATHGFVFHFKQGASDLRFAYVADCGYSSIPNIASKIRDADILALEFNHDEKMEKESGRHPYLIQRVLGPTGHLSNKMAANLLDNVKSPALKTVVQLHLSQDCNHPELAMTAARKVVPNIPVHQTTQHQIGPVIKF